MCFFHKMQFCDKNEGWKSSILARQDRLSNLNASYIKKYSTNLDQVLYVLCHRYIRGTITHSIYFHPLAFFPRYIDWFCFCCCCCYHFRGGSWKQTGLDKKNVTTIHQHDHREYDGMSKQQKKRREEECV